ncbi:hypothetical protein HYH02_004789 [Chlamydomonas schloesseri]|uniref:Uncharacterized protein n=1 Tax=Chlamydomonas schloesseri TaxID=2026947 RepID=A0A835WML3_9CHLO|nr:hypothetical protein HYH02_004789 [Chlamydomonas schloesseri]|eukprot:KAG2450280.1 hypothetical protein HYH02_004789 [Chlamydomonas schloesseri]
MDVNPAQREQLRTVLQARGADLTRIGDAVLDTLWINGYCNERALQEASWRGLTKIGLQPSLVDHILALQAPAARSDVSQPPITMAVLKEALELQAATLKQALEGQAATMQQALEATTKQALEGQAATTKQALEATFKVALSDNRAAWRFPVSTVDWDEVQRSWAKYLDEVPRSKKTS